MALADDAELVDVVDALAELEDGVADVKAEVEVAVVLVEVDEVDEEAGVGVPRSDAMPCTADITPGRSRELWQRTPAACSNKHAARKPGEGIVEPMEITRRLIVGRYQNEGLVRQLLSPQHCEDANSLEEAD